MKNEIKKIPTHLIDIGENIRNTKTDYAEDLFELGQSIKSVGQLQPCIVYPRGDRYILKYGSRRFRACLQAGIPTVDCIISSEFKDEKERILTQAIENEHRKGMTDKEREKYICDLKNMGMSIEEIAKGLKKSKGWISKALKAYNLREKNAELLDGFTGEIDTATMYQFDKLSTENLNRIIEEAKNEDNKSETLGKKIRKEVSKLGKSNNPININYIITEKDKKITITNSSPVSTELDIILISEIKKYYSAKGYKVK